jgi:hypothetical protein
MANRIYGESTVKNMRFRVLGSKALAVAMFLAVASFGWAQAQSNTVMVKATKHAIAPPLSQLVPIPPHSGGPSSLPEEDKLRMPRKGTTTQVQDSALQASSDTISPSGLSTLATVPGLNILGQGTGFPGSTTNTNTSDPNLAVGPTQFVQFINDAFTVFNKSDGSVAYGPAHGNTLWQALGAPCSSSPNLDEIVQFDKLANRWVMLMAVFTAPNYFCLAVSTTSDAVHGGWNLYAFEEPGNNICHCRMQPDYPKLAVWPDGYYLSYNQGWNGNFEGAAACVVDRNSMLNGAAATMQCFNSISANYGTMLPSDVDGITAPPVGSPNYFLNFDYGNDQSLDLWQFHVDWTNPANSTFTGPTNIPVAAFTEACGETVTELFYTTGDCIPQAGTAQGLDSYGDRLMYRLAYRNFGSYEALVTNHTVTIGTSSSQTGIRWYELQNTGAGFGLYQQGTYAPDSNYRWMGSIAMDKVGDIAMAYSVSGSTISPDIGYTGRVPGDPLGQMESEIDVLSSAGIPHGSRTGSFLWADYSSLAVDPTDDCTFFYTTEYIPTNGSNWSTRIASFSFPSCTGQTFTLTVSEVGQGTVTSTDGNINCTNGTGSCSAAYAPGSPVTLNATAGSSWTFGGWSGACTGGNPCNVVMNSNLTATATFGQNVTLTVNEVGKGTVTSTDGQINCTNGSGTCSAVYLSGTSVTLNATAATGYTFSGWSGPCSGRNACSFVMNSSLTATATFVTSPSWAVVHKASKSGAITNITIPATGKGNLIAVALMFNGTTSVASISDNAGNAYVSAGARAASGPFSVEIWYAQNSVAGATVITPTFVGAPTSIEITTWEVSGVLSLPPGATNTATGTVTLNNTPGPAVTTKEAGDFIISVLLLANTNISGISTGNEFTNDFRTNGNGWAHITSNSSSVGTHQASWSIANPTGKYAASTVAFAP